MSVLRPRIDGETAEAVVGSCLEEIDRDECFALLATQSVGRLAMSVPNDAPLVVPVNFVLDGEAVLFRTGPGAKLRLLAVRPVSFQVDSFDPGRRSGWSVLARGRAHEIGRREVGDVSIDPWIVPGNRHWVRLDLRSISGRRLPGVEP
jgi:uncharacterized protein